MSREQFPLLLEDFFKAEQTLKNLPYVLHNFSKSLVEESRLCYMEMRIKGGLVQAAHIARG